MNKPRRNFAATLKAVTLLQKQFLNLQVELQWNGQGAALSFAHACGPFGRACQRVPSFLYKWFFKLGSVSQFSQIGAIITWRLGKGESASYRSRKAWVKQKLPPLPIRDLRG